MNEVNDLHTVISGLLTGRSRVFPAECDAPGVFEGYREALAFAVNIAARYESEAAPSPEEREIFRELRRIYKDAEHTMRTKRISAYIYGFAVGARLALECYADIRHPRKRALRRLRKHRHYTLPHKAPRIIIMPLCTVNGFDD